METYKAIVLSTGHLTKEEFEDLRLDRERSYRHIQHEYGSILVISPSEDFDSLSSANLAPIIAYCRSNNIRYIDFDQDGPEEEEFPVFEWPSVKYKAVKS